MNAIVKVGIAIDLDELRQLMREFIDEYPADNPCRSEYEWRFSTFLYWLRKRREKEADDGQEEHAS